MDEKLLFYSVTGAVAPLLTLTKSGSNAINKVAVAHIRLSLSKTFVVDHEQACVASECCCILRRDSQCTYFTEKSDLRIVKRADFIRY